MALTGHVICADWSVATETVPVPDGFACTIRVEHCDPSGTQFSRQFRHASVFADEHEAMLAGLREGIDWINLKISKTIGV
jgi:hypothetical protein